MACCSTHGVIDQVTAMPVGLLHLGYLTSSFDLLRTLQCWFGHPSTTRSLGLAACWESHMPSHYPRPAPSFPSMFSGQATPVSSRVPSWVKSFWCPPSGTAQSCSCTRPCVSAHHTWIGVKWIYLVWVPARHVALKAPHPSQSDRERHSSATQSEWTSALAFLCMHAGTSSVQEPTHVCTVKTGPPRHKCWLIRMEWSALYVFGL